MVAAGRTRCVQRQLFQWRWIRKVGDVDRPFELVERDAIQRVLNPLTHGGPRLARSGDEDAPRSRQGIAQRQLRVDERSADQLARIGGIDGRLPDSASMIAKHDEKEKEWATDCLDGSQRLEREIERRTDREKGRVRSLWPIDGGESMLSRVVPVCSPLAL